MITKILTIFLELEAIRQIGHIEAKPCLNQLKNRQFSWYTVLLYIPEDLYRSLLKRHLRSMAQPNLLGRPSRWTPPTFLPNRCRKTSQLRRYRHLAPRRHLCGSKSIGIVDFPGRKSRGPRYAFIWRRSWNERSERAGSRITTEERQEWRHHSLSVHRCLPGPKG